MRDLVPSPLARLLLDLGERRADGSVELGHRIVELRRGEVTDVRGAFADESLGEFLAQAGRLTDEQVTQVTERARSEGVAFELALVRSALMSAHALSDARRALLLDRLVRGISQTEEDGVTPTFVPGTPAAVAHAAPIALMPLLLDALARRAATGDAEAVGSRATQRIESLPLPQLERALRWAELDRVIAGLPTVSTVLVRDAAAAPRIAALVRAGFLRLVEPARSVPPPPPPRPQSLAPAARPSHGLRLSELGGGMTAPMPSLSLLPPPKPAQVVLEPGAAPGPERPDDLATPLRAFPPEAKPLEDPLEPVEAELARLEQISAGGGERAALWKQAARLWQNRYGSIEEAARCFREAAAADPGDALAMQQSAVLCAARGDPKLACAYGRAAAALAAPGEAREEALLGLALWSLRAGDADGSVMALRSAANEETASVTALELLARRLASRGEIDEAVEQTLLAASRTENREPQRARALVADALALKPGDPGLASALARALAGDGLGDAAALVLADAARRATNVEDARRLRSEAAEQADENGRSDVAAELWLEAFDLEPDVEAVHEPLVACLEAAHADADLAVVLEEVAAHAEPESRTEWLLRAARAHTTLPGGHEAALALVVRAATHEPDAPGPIEALREKPPGDRDSDLVADALEQVARAALTAGAASAPTVLEQLATLESERIDGARRALWAWERLLELSPDHAEAQARTPDLRGKVRITAALVAQAEKDLAAASADARPAAARKLATLLRDDPNEHATAAALYRASLAVQPDDTAAALAAERLLVLAGDRAGLLAHLADRGRAAPARPERARALLRLAQVASEASPDAAREACAALLAITPGHREGAARLLRLGQRSSDVAAQRLALERRAETASDPRARGRALALSARLLAATGDVTAAAAKADDALAHDPRAADAASLLVGVAAELPPARAAATLSRARALLGDTPALLASLGRAARAAGEASLASEAFDALIRILPGEADPALARLALRVAGDDPRAILAAAASVLAPEAVGARTLQAILDAVSRLSALGAHEDAVTLGLRGLDRLGATEEALRHATLALAAALGVAPTARALYVAAIERWAFATHGEARLPALAALAHVHREAGDRAAEARAHLRTLQLSLYDTPALTRLAEIYGEAGEGEKLLAVLALGLEAQADDETLGADVRDARRKARRATLLDLAAAAVQVAGDPVRAESFLEALLRESAGDRDATVHALGALVTIGRPLAAVERLLGLAETATPEDAAVLCERAVAIAEHEAHDDALTLRTAAHGLEIVPSHAPLLVVFERLALAMREVEIARRIYRRLVDAAMGPNSRRALLYRAARFAERAGEADAALDAFAEAFTHAPSAGVIFGAIERLAAATQRWDTLVDALQALADRARGVDARIVLLVRAARVLEERVGARDRAFAALFAGWETSTSAELEAELSRVLRALRASNPEQGQAAGAKLVTALRGLVEQAWDAEDRANWLVRTARVEAEDLDDLDAARKTLAEAWSAFGDSTMEPEARVTWLLRVVALGTAVRALGDDARRAAREALAIAPGDAAARAAGTALEIPLPDIPPPSEEDTSGSPFGPAVSARPPPAVEPPAAEPPLPAAAPIPLERRVTRTTPAYTEKISPPFSVAETQRSATGVKAREQRESKPTPAFGMPSAPVSEPTPPVPGPPAHPPEPSQPDRIARESDAGPGGGAVVERSRERRPSSADHSSAERALPSVIIAPQTPADEAQSATDELDARPTLPRAISRPPGGNLGARIAEVVANGDAAAAETLGRELATNDARTHEAALLLRQAVRLDPTRVTALRALHDVALRRGAAAEERVAGGALSLFDPAVPPPPPVSLEGVLGPEVLVAVRREHGPDAARHVLRSLWDNAQPLFRRPLSAWGVLGTDRISAVAPTSVAHAYAAAAQIVGAQGCPFFVRQGGGGEILIATTAPPAIVAGASFNGDDSSLRFRLGRALELARPEHVLVAALDPDELATLVAAIKAAFGPAEHAGGVAREAAAIAADLWRTMPARAQQRVREDLAALGKELDAAELRTAVHAAAACAGLLAAGNLRASLLALRAEDDAFGALDVTTEAGFVAAARSIPAVRALIRFALSDDLLVAVARAS